MTGQAAPFSAFAATTEAEAAMAAAVAAGDQIAYLKALSDESLVLPITPDAAAGREPVRWATSEAFGVKYVLAFTSGPALPPHVEHVRRAPLFEIVHAVAELGWGLAVDPGLSLQSFLAPEAVRDLKAWEPVWTPLDFALRAAVEADDREAYMAALLECSLVLPLPTDEELAPAAATSAASTSAAATSAASTSAASASAGATSAGATSAAATSASAPAASAPAGSAAAFAASVEYWTAVPSDPQPSAAVSRDVTDPEFPWWRTERIDGLPVILAFTSVGHLQAELGDREWIAVGFIEIVASWPEEGRALRLNPGGTNGMELPAEALRSMYELFLAAMGEKHRRPDE